LEYPPIVIKMQRDCSFYKNKNLGLQRWNLVREKEERFYFLRELRFVRAWLQELHAELSYSCSA